MKATVSFTQRKINAFKRERLSLIALIFLLISCFISFTAEIWANNKPLYMKFQGKSYLPAIIKYHPTEFGYNDDFQSNYRLIAKKADHVIWPIIKWNAYETNESLESFPAPPSKDNWLGTDDRGRDVLTRIIYGFRYSMFYALLVWFLCTIMATIAGGLMGYFGSWLDLLGQRILEILETIPVLMLLLILVSIFKPNLGWLILISSVFGWMTFSRYVRGEFLRLRHLPFVEFAKAQGASDLRIIFVHILPNSLTPLITFSPFMIANNIYGLSALDFLGFGLPPPTPSWGELLSQAKSHVTVAWWLATFPSLALFLTLTVLTLLGNGLRRAFDPKAT